jgi:catechol 2,3-dioxygenase-like lactoylglutathione lyase family enzyme
MDEIIRPPTPRAATKDESGKPADCGVFFLPPNLKESAMLSNASVTTILPVVDMNRARAFYEGKLGLKPEGPKPDGDVVYHVGGGAQIALHRKEGGTKADHTALSFEVGDIEGDIRDLEKAGVVFEDYDLPDLKTVNHICVMGDEKAAWFKDTEGNFLCLHQEIH